MRVTLVSCRNCGRHYDYRGWWHPSSADRVTAFGLCQSCRTMAYTAFWIGFGVATLAALLAVR
jgi:hypothetical protein